METMKTLSQSETKKLMKPFTSVSFHHVLGLLLIGLLTACSNSKTTPTVNNLSSAVLLTSDKLLAQCGRSSDANFTFKTAIAHDANGQLTPDVIKFRMTTLSTAVTASGNTIRFFKWRVNGAATELDSTPLQFITYDYSTSQSTSSAIDTIATTQINANMGIAIQLNDPIGVFQVIKAVVYGSDGKTMIAQINTLIPAFYAKPSDYQYNGDGTVRAGILQQLHPLANVSVGNWSDDQYIQTFNSLCI